MKLEEKRMKLDQYMMEIEECHLREDKVREEHQKREERKFQLRVMMMRQQEGMGSPSPPFTPAYDYSALTVVLVLVVSNGLNLMFEGTGYTLISLNYIKVCSHLAT